MGLGYTELSAQMSIFAALIESHLMQLVRIISLLLFFLPLMSNAQRWEGYRNEVGGFIGPTNMMGDVGGGKDIGVNSLLTNWKDFDGKATRLAVGGHFIRMFSDRTGAGGTISGGFMGASDALTQEPARRNRNLTVRTLYLEVTGIGRFYFKKENFGHVYKLRGARSFFLLNIAAYGYLGIGLTAYSPQGQYQGKWVGLRKLGTEGQGIMPGKDPYGSLTVIYPFGLGLKYALGNKWNIGAEYGARVTTTDYLDDVSTRYYDNAAILAANGPAAAALADPSGRPAERETWTNPGEKRGDPKGKDYYMILQVSVNYRFVKGTSFKPRL